MADAETLDDPLWEYVLATKLKPYIEPVKYWWDHYEELKVANTGVFPLVCDDIECPPGLMVRVTSTAVRSPIKHVQAFPFVPTSYLQIAGVTGGVNKMVERVCQTDFELDGLCIIEKHNLPSTYHKGQIICFVPKNVMEGTKKLGKFVYMTLSELQAMAHGTLPESVTAKCYQYIL